MFEARFPEKAPAKLVHIQKASRHNAGLVRTALCGRRVNLMALGELGTATCPKCAAEALILEAVSVEGR